MFLVNVSLLTVSIVGSLINWLAGRQRKTILYFHFAHRGRKYGTSLLAATQLKILSTCSQLDVSQKVACEEGTSGIYDVTGSAA